MIKLGVYYQIDKYISLDSLMKSLTNTINTITEINLQSINYDITLEKRYTKTYTTENKVIYFEEITIKTNNNIDDNNIDDNNIDDSTNYIQNNLIEYLKRSYMDLDAKDVHIIRFHDSNKLSKNLDYYKQLFKLEMKIRLYCTRILNDTCNTLLQTPFHKLHLSDLYKPPKDKDKDKDKDKNKQHVSTPIEEELKEQYENDLFYIGFKEYTQISNGFKQEPVFNLKNTYYINYVTHFETVDELIKHMNTLKQIKINDEYSDFLISLKEILNSSIEPMRNSIAHNRFPSDKLIINFEKGMRDIKSKFKQFEEQENLEESSKNFINPPDIDVIENNADSTFEETVKSNNQTAATIGIAALTILGGIALYHILKNNTDDNDD